MKIIYKTNIQESKITLNFVTLSIEILSSLTAFCLSNFEIATISVVEKTMGQPKCREMAN